MSTPPLPTPELLQELWTFPGYGDLLAQQPLVAAGDRVLAVTPSALFAVDIVNGAEPIVDAEHEDQGFPYSFRSDHGGDHHVTAAGGVVYFMDGSELIARRLSDGLPLLTRNAAGDRVPWTPPVLRRVSALLAADDKVIAVHLGDGGATHVSGYVAVDGARAFGPVKISDLSPGRVSYGDRAVFFVADGRLHGVNVDFGDPRFASTGGGVATERLDPSVAPCVSPDVVVAVGGGRLHMFETRTGAKVFAPIAPSTPGAVWRTPILADKGSLVIASNTREVVALRTRDGGVAWRTALADPGEPTLLRGQVLVNTERRTTLALLSLANGRVERRLRLPQTAGTLPPVVTNETLFVADAGGTIVARSFARQHAAYFDGRTSRIDVVAADTQFDFGQGDFTIEAWIRSSEGGEIVSSHPTQANARSHGFRLNLGQNGELRVAIVDADEARVHAGRTRETRANDGEWHHLALIRRGGALLALLDGKSLDVFFRDDSAAGLAIGGASALTIGAYRPAPGQPAQDHFQGLIRELRIWDRALDVAAVQNNRHVQLSGAEPRLKGLWSLAEVQKPPRRPENAVKRPDLGTRETFHTPASAPTDLVLDRTGFPYLLHEVATHWPYAGTWAARGQQPVASRAARSDQAIAFATNNAVYGVRRADGRRLWQIDMGHGLSAPVADGARFLVLTGDDGVVAIDALTGESARLPAFAGLKPGPGAGLAAPAVSATHLAAGASAVQVPAGAPRGLVKLLDRQSDPVRVREVRVPEPVRELAFGQDRLFALCGESGALQIAVIDPATAASTLLPVSHAPFTTDHEWLFCVRAGTLTRLVAARPAQAPLPASASIPGTITGMAARRDDDLLVVTTDRGAVHGLALSDLASRWTAAIPPGRAAGANVVHAPVFDGAGRLYCTTASGTLAVLDGATGARLGLYLASQSIVTPPLVAAGTAYFGCAEPTDERTFRDGALHSVVFGQTTVLRLGLDERGAPSGTSTRGVVDIGTVEPDKHSLHLLDPARSCVEAWVSLPTPGTRSPRRLGGGVLGICPTAAGGFGLNLLIEPDGTLEYRARSRQGTAWTTLRAEAKTGVNDGRWHHVAVSREREDQVAVYVDGKPVPDVRLTRTEEASVRTVDGIKAYLGAIAADSLGATRPFCGMIAEVRVWDTFLEPTEIAARMHVKLRGNEPDLLAYWNFDWQSVEDAGPEDHDGTLAVVGADPVWWLSDLAFDKPSYPFVTTAGKILQQTTGQPTAYEVTFTVHRADGSGMPGHPLDLWYVRRRQDDPAETLFDGVAVTGVTAAAEPEPGAPTPDGKRRVHSLVTGSNGAVTVLVAATRAGHAPAIDLRAGFMPRHQRLHANVLLDEQKLVPPTPPSLLAQSKLIQDYAYTSGSRVDEKRDRSTWRTVIRAVNPDGTVRIGEPVSLWATAQLSVEVAGRSYAINRENAAELVTDSEGEVVVVSEAAALTAPALLARAGFMHRNDRVQIAPDQDLHRQLTTVSGADLTKKRATKWTRDTKDGDGQALLSGDYAPHADKVAEAIVTVMAAAKPAAADGAPAPRGRAHRLRRQARAHAAARRLTADAPIEDPEPMRQPPRELGTDRVVMLRATPDAPRTAPFDPDGLRDALGAHAGFVIERVRNARGKPDVRFELLDTRARVDAERGEATPEPVLLRGFFDDVWNGIKDTAVDIYEGAVKIVVSIKEAVEVAIHKLVDGIVRVVHVVADSVVAAVNAVAGFFEQLGVLIKQVIEFLRALFDWKAILATKDILSELFVFSVDAAKRAIAPARIEAVFVPLMNLGPQKPAPGGQGLAAGSAAAGEPHSPAIDEARGVQGQMVMQKSRENGLSTTASSDGPKGAAGGGGLDDLIRQVPAVVSGLMDLSPADMVDRLLAALKDGFQAGVRLFIDQLKALSAAAVEVVDWAMGLLRTEIRIPFLSDLYSFITGGSKLTLLDLFCLALAVPVHVAHVVVTALMGRRRTFAEDNQGLVARLRAAEHAALPPPRTPLQLASSAGADPPSAAVPAVRPMDTTYETAIVVLRAVNIGAGLVSDAMFTRTVSTGGIGAASATEARVRGFVKVVKGGTGIAAALLTAYGSNIAFETRLQAGVRPDVWNSIKPLWWQNHAIFAVQALGDLITFGGGLKHVFAPPLPQGLNAEGIIPADPIDALEYGVAKAAFLGCIAAIDARVIFMLDAIKRLESTEQDENLVWQVRLFGYRDIATVIARMPWCMFTQSGANRVRQMFGGGAPILYTTVTAVRAIAQGIALGTHVVAVYRFGQTSS